MPSEKFEQQIREKLAGAQKAPPPGLFEAIQADLQPGSAPSRRALGWWWLGGSLLTAAAVAAVLWLSFPSPPAPAALTEPLIAYPLPPVPESKGAASTEPLPLARAEASTEAAQAASTPTAPVSVAEAKPQAWPGTSAISLSTLPAATPVPRPSGSSPSLPPAPRQIAAAPLGPLASSPLALTSGSPAVGLLPTRPEKDPYYLRLLLQAERASRGNPLLLLTPPAVDHSLVETDQRFLAPNVGQVHVLSYPKQRVALGALLGRRITPRVSLETGLLFSHSEEGVYQRGVTDPSLFSQGRTPAQEAVRQYDLELRWRQSYLEIPLRAQVHLWRSAGQSLSLMAGLALNRSVQRIEPDQAVRRTNNQEFVYPTADQPYLDPGGDLVTVSGESLLSMRRWHSQVQTGLAYATDCGLNRRVYLSPTFKYLLRGAYEGSAALDQMRYHLGLEVGIQWGNR